jgi:choline/ethanolamine kinase
MICVDPEASRSLNSSGTGDIPSSDIELSVITGGLTNTLYKASVNGTCSHLTALVRVFGDTRGLIDRQIENAIYAELSHSGIGPKLLGVFPWGRLEEFLEGYRPLRDGSEMMDDEWIEMIAEKVAELHSIEIVNEEFNLNIFEIIYKYFRILKTLEIVIPDDLETFYHELKSVYETKFELFQNNENLRNLLKPVSCHNDLLSGNIMVNESRELRFIDFEYSSINFAISDIANFFTAVPESNLISGLQMDAKNNFPNNSQISKFMKKYLNCVNSPVVDTDGIMELIWLFAALNELRWCLWGLIQKTFSKIDFDYSKYFNERCESLKYYRSKVLGH